MSLNRVMLTGRYTDGSGSAVSGTLEFTPSAPLTAAAETVVLPQSPVLVTLNGSGSFSVPLYATDNADLSPAGWTWGVTLDIAGLPPSSWNFFLPYTGGATQDISTLTPVAP